MCSTSFALVAPKYVAAERGTSSDVYFLKVSGCQERLHPSDYFERALSANDSAVLQTAIAEMHNKKV